MNRFFVRSALAKQLIFYVSVLVLSWALQAHADGTGVRSGNAGPGWGYDLPSTKTAKANPGQQRESIPDNFEGVYLDNVVYGRDLLKAGDRQLIQINFANSLKVTKGYDMRVRIIKPDGRNEFLPLKRVTVGPRSVEGFLFRYDTDPRLQGEYKVEINLFKNTQLRPDYQILWSGVFSTYLNRVPETAATQRPNIPDDIYALFTSLPDSDVLNIPLSAIPDRNGVNPNGEGNATANGDGSGGSLGAIPPGILPPGNSGSGNAGQQNAAGSPGSEGGAQSLNNAPGTAGTQSGAQGGSESQTSGEFSRSSTADLNSPIDLGWRNLRLSSNNILRGENINASVFLSNNGQGIAENVSYALYIVRELFKGNYDQNAPILEGVYPFIAPGETKQINFPITIDPTLVPGEYLIVGVIDKENKIPEFNPDNNFVTSRTIFLSEILPVEPEDSITINSNSEVTFSWRSNQYVFFYVQLSRTPDFEENDIFMQLPSSEPTPLNAITALRGEMENLRKRTAEENNNLFYWRVVGFDPQNARAESPARKIFFNLLQ